jgi:hypothetical protein
MVADPEKSLEYFESVGEVRHQLGVGRGCALLEAGSRRGLRS